MPISIMIKPSSSACNLKCEYCFYSDVVSHREEKDKRMITEETANTIIEKALDFEKEYIVFVFQGGEPLLRGLEFFEAFVKKVNQTNKNGTTISYSLQTNGTLLDENWCKFFRENGFLVGVSLDGDETVNAYRKYPNGKPAFDDIMAGIELLKKYNIPFNVLSVLTKKVANNFRSTYRFFKSNDLHYLQYIKYLKPFETDDDEYSLSNEDYLGYLNSAFKIYYNDILRGYNISIRQFDNYRLLQAGNQAEQCGMNGNCSKQFVIEGDGSVYPCDFYCTDEWYLGNINDQDFEQLTNSERANKFFYDSLEYNEECKNCQYFRLCRGGGCKRNKVAYDHCQAYKNFFDKNKEFLQNISR